MSEKQQVSSAHQRTQEEMAHTCRGTINLASAFIDTIDSTNFMITNGPSQVYHLRALNEVERQRWVTALELAKAKAIKRLDSDVSDQSGSEDETVGREGKGRGSGAGSSGHDNPLAALQLKLKELTTAYDLVIKNSHHLSKLASELEMVPTAPGGVKAAKPTETFALFKLTSSAMVKAADDFVVQACSTERRWSRALQHEHSLRLKLQENMEALASQMQLLEDEARRAMLPSRHGSSHSGTNTNDDLGSVSSTSTVTVKNVVVSEKPVTSLDSSIDDVVDSKLTESEEDEAFFDASEMFAADLRKSSVVPVSGVQVGTSPGQHRRNVSATSVNDLFFMKPSPPAEVKAIGPQIPSDRRMEVPASPSPSFFECNSPVREWRTTILPKPSHKLSLWSVMKNCIGKDLSKIPMPVNFNEPLSLLQRMSEDLVYSNLLDKAAQCSTTLEEGAYIAAFINSAYASTAARVGKPFNPLLFETFEDDRRSDPQCGYRILAEQVSHHPPMFAMHVEHKDWVFWQEYTVASKFRGKYLVCYPLGCCHVVIYRSQSHYTWNKVTTTVHNIIVGKLWIDQSGDLKITNHTTNQECHVKYHAYSYFSREKQRKITGSVLDRAGHVRYVIHGHWDDAFTLAKVVSGHGKNLLTETPRVLWRAEPPEPGSEVIYGFSKFVCSLNQLEEGVAPTDCRLRPDIRVMEQQNFDLANTEKIKLEEKQRARRRKREALAVQAAEAADLGNTEEAKRLKKESTIIPVWFIKEYDQLTGSMMHTYGGGYWETKATQDWHKLNLPQIF